MLYYSWRSPTCGDKLATIWPAQLTIDMMDSNPKVGRFVARTKRQQTCSGSSGLLAAAPGRRRAAAIGDGGCTSMCPKAQRPRTHRKAENRLKGLGENLRPTLTGSHPVGHPAGHPVWGHMGTPISDSCT